MALPPPSSSLASASPDSAPLSSAPSSPAAGGVVVCAGRKKRSAASSASSGPGLDRTSSLSSSSSPAVSSSPSSVPYDERPLPGKGEKGYPLNFGSDSNQESSIPAGAATGGASSEMSASASSSLPAAGGAGGRQKVRFKAGRERAAKVCFMAPGEGRGREGLSDSNQEAVIPAGASAGGNSEMSASPSSSSLPAAGDRQKVCLARGGDGKGRRRRSV